MAFIIRLIFIVFSSVYKTSVEYKQINKDLLTLNILRATEHLLKWKISVLSEIGPCWSLVVSRVHLLNWMSNRYDWHAEMVLHMTEHSTFDLAVSKNITSLGGLVPTPVDLYHFTGRTIAEKYIMQSKVILKSKFKIPMIFWRCVCV